MTRAFLICALCTLATTAEAAVRDGTLSAGIDLRYQFAPLGSGNGYIHANWDAHPDTSSYSVGVGLSPGADDVATLTDVGDITSTTINNLDLNLASTGIVYYVTVEFTTGTGTTITMSSNGISIAEGTVFTGASGELGTIVRDDADGGFTLDFPPGSGFDVLFGDHFFETVDIPAGTTVYVQPFGREDGVQAGGAIPANPADGWLRLYANDITVDGTIEARGRGYGGGAGAGGTRNLPAQGGSDGISGDGGQYSFTTTTLDGGVGGAAAGGGANLAGVGLDSGATGGGGGSVDGASGNAGDSVGGAGGVGATDGGNGGGGYGAGGGGAGQNYGGGGGGGGTGGEVGEIGSGSAAGGSGAGPGGGDGGDLPGVNDGEGGEAGGYDGPAANTDSSTDMTLLIGGGGGGGAHMESEGAGGGGAGGAAVYLVAANTLIVGGTIVASGAAGGGGGVCSACGNAGGAGGGAGGGGGILVAGASVDLVGSTIRTLGGESGDATDGTLGGKGGDGDADAANGGTVKIFATSQLGTVAPANAGRVFEQAVASTLVADAGGPYAGLVGTPLELDGSGSNDDNSYIVSWEWDLDDDSNYDDATSEFASITPLAAGDFQVGLRVTNALGQVATATATVAFGPRAADDDYSVLEDTTLLVNSANGLLANDTGASITSAVESLPVFGIVTVQSDGSFAYTPVDDYAGPDQFTYTITDFTATTDTATVTITVDPDPDAPEFVAPTPSGQLIALAGEQLTFTVAAVDPDAGDSVVYAITSLPAWATIDSTTGAFVGDPTRSDLGTYSMTLVASDGTLSSEQILIVVVANCATDADCGGGTCGPSGTCVGAAVDGDVCNSSSECQSGICSQGLCCDAICNGDNETCIAVGFEGVCTDIDSIPIPTSCSATPTSGPRPAWLGLLVLLGIARRRRLR